MITVAPAAFASCSAKTLTPPVPSSRTVEPGLARAARKAFQAVVAAIGRVAAAWSDKCAGVGTSPFAGSTIYSATDPGSVAPRILALPKAVRGPPTQFGLE